MSDHFVPIASMIAACLCAALLALMELGRRLGQRRLALDSEGSRVGVAAIEGAVFALVGLLLAFGFSGAAGRFDTRRQLVVTEANAIGTAYLRLSMLSPEHRVPLQAQFRQYVDARLSAYRSLPDMQATKAALAKGAAIQQQIWDAAVVATHDEGYQPAAILLLPALNEMIDITTTRTMTAQFHPPVLIFVLLGVLLLISALFAGIAMAGSKFRSWIHIIGFALTLAITMYVILDLEYPRLGIIRLDAFDQVLVELRQSMQ